MENNKRKRAIITCSIKILIALISIYAYQSKRFLFLLIMLIWLFIDLIRLQYYKLIIDTLVIAIILISAVHFYHYLERARFSLFKNIYMLKVEKIVDNMSELLDSRWGHYSNNIIYVKQGDSIIIYFPTNLNGGSGYAYFSDETARDFWERPSLYFKSAPDESSYKDLEELDERWAYMKLYV